ncbi:MAG: hypothetical protein ABI462_00080 [Ignavibacteria bacterium]
MLVEKLSLRYSANACDIPQKGHGMPNKLRITHELSYLNHPGNKYLIRSKGYSIVAIKAKAIKPNNIPLTAQASLDEIF